MISNEEFNNHLRRYNLGEDKGILPKKERYTLEMQDFGGASEKQKLNALIMQAEEKELLSYVKNPSLVEKIIQEKQASIKELEGNAKEKEVYAMLLRYDAICEAEKDETKILERIEKEILEHYRNNAGGV
ncbi:hypothetical protein ACRE1U_04665 [Helicobacter himalayensis]|uniref:hypothetical protein n=1 Tax=Helicobacter himalayensis TaxID=1591088 RepID=UPI003D6FC8AE